MTSSVQYYSALTPDGQRVLLEVGQYFDRSGQLRDSRNPPPFGWDEKSWGDVRDTLHELSVRVDKLRSVIASDDPDPTAIADLLEQVEQIAGFGTLAAAWCEDVQP